MKTKYILILTIITAFIFISGNKGLGQCIEQIVNINYANGLQICTGYSSSCEVNIYLEQNNSSYIFNPIQLKRPDGSIALGISSASSTYVSDGIRSYIIPNGYFNVVGDWTLNYSTKTYCTNTTNKTVTIKVVGFLDNTIGSDEAICTGSGTPYIINNISLSSNSGYSILWQKSDDGSTWNNIPGATSTTYQPPVIIKTIKYKRYVTTTLLGCTNTSNIVTKSVYNAFTAGAISGNQNNCYNVTPSKLTQITVATGGSLTYNYQWYVSTDGSSFTIVSGATSVNYQPSFQQGIRYFKRRDYDPSCGDSYTNSVTLLGYSSLNVGTITADQTICYNTPPAILSVGTAATGGTGSYTYQWEVSPDGSSFSGISGATGTIYQPPSLTTNKWYRLKVINSCETGYTNSVKVTVHNPLNPGIITADQTICYNITPGTLTVGTAAIGGTGSYTYQWEVSSDGSVFGSVTGATGTSYQPAALTSSKWYRLKVVNSCETGYTNSVKMTVHNLLNTGTITADQTVCYNITPGTLNVGTAATGGTGSYTYQWEVSPNGSSFSAISGAISTSYQPPALTSNNWYRLKVINSCETGYTNSVKVTVNNPLSTGTITADQTICYNTTPGLLNVGTVATGGSGTYTYQWQVSPDGSSFGDITSATGTSYQPTALMSSKWYRLKVINSCETGYTNSVKVTVNNPLSAGTITADQTICYNIIPGLLRVGTIATGGSGTYTYQWQVSSDGSSFSDITIATGTSYQPTALTSSRWYRLIVMNSCESGYTNSVKVTVNNPLRAGTITADQSICYNIIPGLLSIGTVATGGSGTYTYQWQVSSDGSSFGDITSATGTSYQPTALTSSKWYRLKVINSCETGYTNSIKITVYNQFYPGTITADQTICYNIIPSLIITSTTPTGGSGIYTYQWEKSTDGTNWNTIIGATNENFQPGNLVNTTFYRRNVVNVCVSSYSNTVIITVRPNIIAGIISQTQTICYNTAPSTLISASYPSGGTGSFTFQWQNSLNNTSWNNISGATSETYQPGVMNSSLYFRRLETSGTCATVQTNSLQITVNNPLVAGTVKNDQTICYRIPAGMFLTNTYPTGGTGTYSYQWQKLVGSTWTDILLANSETYTSDLLTATSYFRRAETSGTCGTVSTNQIVVTVRNQFLPGVIGSSQTVNYGVVPSELVSLQSPTGGVGTFTYQWQNSLDSSTWSNITGATSERFQPPAQTVKKYFRRLTTDGSCGTIETNVLTINVNSLLVPGAIVANQTICYNTAPAQLTTSVIPTGGNGTYLYQWQKTEDGTNWTDITAANSDSYQSVVLIKTTYFRKRVTSASIDDYTNIVTVTVHDNFIPGVIGADQTVCYSETPASLNSVSLPSGGNESYTNQWKSSLNSSSWTVVTGATDSYYEPPALTVKTYYKKVVTDLCGVKETNIVTVNVNPLFTPGTIGDNQTIVFNNIPQKLDVSTVTTGGTGSFTYQWQKSIDNVTWTNITSANDPFYQPTATSQTTYFKRLTTSGSCGTKETNIITITVTTEILVGTIGIDQSICYEAAPALLTTITGPSSGVVINSQNWMKSEDAVEWSDISTATSNTYQSGVLNKTTYFRKKIVTAGNGTIFTNIVTITVNPAFAPGTIGSDQSVCKASPAAPITTTLLPTGQMIQNLWQISDNNASWTDITGATNDYYDGGVLSATKFFRKKVTSSCGTGYTNCVKITVNDELQSGIIGSDHSIAYNTPPSLLTGSLPTGGSGTFSYQWYYSINNIDWQVVISGGDGKDYQSGALSQKTYFKRKVTGGLCGEKYSNIVTITVFDSVLPGVVSDAQSICYNTVPALLSGTSPGGGTGQYSYKWQYSLQGVTWIDIPSEVGISYRPEALKVNTYYRRAVTSGNSTVYSNFVMIKVYDQISLPTTDLKTSYCKGSAVNINVVNPAYLSYKWYDSQHAYVMDGTKYTLNSITSSNTVYVKSLTENSCLSDYLEQKIVVDNVKANFTQDITTVTLGDAVKFTSTSINPSSYFWNFFEGDIINETNPVHYYNTLGVNSKKFDVKLTIVSPSGCVDSLSQIGLITVVNNVTRIESNKAAEFSYYPNPVKEKLFLKSDEIIKTVKILNINGKMIQSLTFDNEIVSVDFSQLKSGIYLLEINGLKDSKKNIKIIKQ